MEYNDKEIVCVNKDKDKNCDGVFVFEVGEQVFYEEHGYTEPKRCPSCRAKKKAEKEGHSSSSNGNERRNNRGNGPRLPRDNNDFGEELN